MLVTDVSLTGWGAVMSGHPARGLWSGRHLNWHINRLEMLAVFQALKHFLPELRDRHVLVRTDNTSVVSYINHQEGLHLRPLYKLAHQILVWSQGKLLSLRAVYILGHLFQGADVLSKQWPRLGEWRLHPEVVELIWGVLVRLRSSGESALGRHLATAGSPVLAGPSMVLGPDFPPRRLSVEIPVRRDLLSQAGGTILHPRSELWKLWVWKPPVSQPRLLRPSSNPELPQRGNYRPSPLPTGTVLGFLQARFATGFTHSTLKVYVAAIAAFHSPLGGQLVEKHPRLHVSSTAHSSWNTVASKAFSSGVPLSDICNAAGWSMPLTFVRFYGLIFMPLLAPLFSRPSCT
ncbi:ORF V: Enzymatic polyprotein [Labeo rohita]|uniref:ORF V: Enzymatic polyprotein n=1 Tax=Labeo rohita TaxID=84645 RepID=A0ABQ8L622_LABRO|nr:ORF V: Enzymatic polyprotein [Labeo rohita]